MFHTGLLPVAELASMVDSFCPLPHPHPGQDWAALSLITLKCVDAYFSQAGAL